MKSNRLGGATIILSAKEHRECDEVATADSSQEDATPRQVDNIACDAADNSRPVWFHGGNLRVVREHRSDEDCAG